jgi:prepilin-type N-terminal cleavage/methylation domain-containing protein
MSNRIELGSRVLNSERGTTMLARMRDARKNESGFTLIELLIVIVILGVLSGIVVFSVRGITSRGEAAACNANVKTVVVASEAYYAQNNLYAADIAGLSGFLQSTPKTRAADPTKGVDYTTAVAPATPTIVGGSACTP